MWAKNRSSSEGAAQDLPEWAVFTVDSGQRKGEGIPLTPPRYAALLLRTGHIRSGAGPNFCQRFPHEHELAWVGYDPFFPRLTVCYS